MANETGKEAPPDEPRRPRFAEGFPRVPELDALVEAFSAGDYARVRREAPKLAERSDDEEVKKAARNLRQRVEADPLAIWLLVLTAALLVGLAGYWVIKAHPHGADEGHGAAPPGTSASANAQ